MMNYINHLFAMFYALKRRLELLPTSCSSTEKTTVLTEEIKRFCDHECASFTCEVPIKPIEYRNSGKLRRGSIDVFIRTTDKQVFAIEIDRANKLWSLDKLSYCGRRFNAIPIWIRWSGRVDCPVPRDIVVVDLTGHSLAVTNDYLLQQREPPAGATGTERGKAYSVEEIRKTYTNAYKPWTTDDDARLVSLHKSGMGCVELAGIFGRNVGAISSRIKHLTEDQGSNHATHNTARPRRARRR